MPKTATIDVKDHDLLDALQGFLKSILKREEIGALLAPWRLPQKNRVMPTLLTDPAQMNRVDPLTPAFPLNSAKVVSRLTRKAAGKRVAAVMRPCEIRDAMKVKRLAGFSTRNEKVRASQCSG